MSVHRPRFEQDTQHMLQSGIKPQAETPQPQLTQQPVAPAMIMRAIENPTPQTLTPDVLRALQQSHGNQYVQRLLEAASTTSTPAMPIQAKMTVTPAGDKYEQEADAVASQVIQQVDHPVQRQADEDELMLKREVVQRQDDEDELMLKRDVIQRDPDGMDVSGNIEDSIQRARGGGQSLPDNVRAPMESAFGSDFSGVRVHQDSEADALNQSLQARAFTTGQDIFFKQGEYNPDSSSGQELLAHELTHVVQQNGVQPKKED